MAWMSMIFAVWDSNSTAVFMGIASGIVGIVAPACVALWTQIRTAGIKTRADEAANRATEMAKAQAWDRARADKLEQRVWEIEAELRECTKASARWQARCEDLEIRLSGGTRSTPPSSEPKCES